MVSILRTLSFIVSLVWTVTASKGVAATRPDVDTAMAEAAAATARSDYITAMRTYSGVLAAMPKHVPAMEARGRLRLRMGDAAGAALDLTNAIKVDARRASAWEARAAARLQLEKWPEALADCEELFKLAPGSPAAHAHRGWARWNTGDVRGATEDLAIALADPAQFAGRAAAHAYRAAIRCSMGEYTTALQDANAALQHDPDHLVARLARGMARHNLEGGTAGWEDATFVIGRSSRNAEAWLLRANVRLKASDLDGAGSEVDRALSFNPRLVPALSLRALIAFSRDLPESGHKDIDAAIAIDPAHPEPYLIRARFWRNELKFVKALADLDIAIATNRAPPDTYLARGTLRDLTRDHAGAVEDFTAYLDRTRAYKEALLPRGMAHLANGNSEAARADFERLLLYENVDVSELKLLIGITALNTGDLAEAERIFAAEAQPRRQAMQNNAAATRAYLAHGLVLRLMGRMEDAAKALRFGAISEDSRHALWLFITEAEVGDRHAAMAGLLERIEHWESTPNQTQWVISARMLLDSSMDVIARRVLAEEMDDHVRQRIQRDLLLYSGYRQLVAGDVSGGLTKLRAAHSLMQRTEIEYHAVAHDIARFERRKDASATGAASPARTRASDGSAAEPDRVSSPASAP